MAKNSGGGFNFPRGAQEPKADEQQSSGPDIHVRNHSDAVETGGMQTGQDSPVHISLTGEAELIKEPIKIVDGPTSTAKMEALAFNEEMVTIEIASSEDPNAEMLIEVGVNNKKQFFRRGQQQTVRRKYVEQLARTKVTKYMQNVESTDPTVVNRLMPTTVLRYPFTLIEDKNPRGGQAWLRKILAEAI